MHELPVIKKVLDICLKHAEASGVRKVLSIDLKVGKLSDLEPEWMQRFFDFASKGTLAEGAKLVVERTPVVLQCEACSQKFEVDLESRQEVECHQCGAARCAVVSGREYYINNMEVL